MCDRKVSDRIISDRSVSVCKICVWWRCAIKVLLGGVIIKHWRLFSLTFFFASYTGAFPIPWQLFDVFMNQMCETLWGTTCDIFYDYRSLPRKTFFTVHIHQRGTEQPLFNLFSMEAERKARTGNCGTDREAELVVKASKSWEMHNFVRIRGEGML